MRDGFHTQGLPRRHDTLAIKNRPYLGDFAGLGTSGDNRVFGGNGRHSAIGTGYHHVATIAEAGSAHDDIDFVFLHQKRHALGHLLDHTIFVFDRGIPVEADAGGVDAKLGTLVDFFKQIGGMQQRLGGDTADIQTNATHHRALDNRDFQAQLR